MHVCRLRVGSVARGLVAILALSTAAACGGDSAAPSSPAVTTPEANIAPLTGLPVDTDELADRPAMVVKVDNGPNALGRQFGLSEADVVYNERVEGGATRLAAVYHSAGPVEVGPVRSARSSDLHIVSNLNHPVFVFSGANGGVLGMVAAAAVDDLYYDRTPGLFLERGTGDLRLVADTATFYDEVGPDAGVPSPLFTYRDDGTPQADGAEVDGVSVDYGGQVSTGVGYVPASEGWARMQGGEPHLDASGGAITTTNAIIQFIEYSDSGFVDKTGATSPKAELIGEGDAWILTGGELIEGRWSRESAIAPTRYTDAAGQPVDLEPGRTWVELAPIGSGTIEGAAAG